MKKIKGIVVLATLVVGFVLVGCKNATNNDNSGDVTPPAKPEVVYNVGDVVLLDGSVLAYDKLADLTEEDLIELSPVAVIFRAKDGTKPALGVGVGQTDKNYKWAIAETPGWSSCIEDIICIPTKDDMFVSGIWDDTKTWEGETDGSDNWNKILAFFDKPEQSENKEAGQSIDNYPAFKFALNYGDTVGLTGDYKNNWYLPSTAELITLYQSITKVNDALQNLAFKASPIKVGSEFYISGSQYKDSAGFTLSVCFKNGWIDNVGKVDSYYVRVIRAF